MGGGGDFILKIKKKVNITEYRYMHIQEKVNSSCSLTVTEDLVEVESLTGQEVNTGTLKVKMFLYLEL